MNPVRDDTATTVCPVCGHIATAAEYYAAGARIEAAGFSCIGRWIGGRPAFEKGGKGPCNYTGGGLFKLNPWTVIIEDGGEHHVFAFAEVEAVAA